MDFIREIIAEHNRTGKYDGKVVTRFPPEPNGYLHIGHAKSICLNFGIALENGERGRCHLRFDDTNPETEDIEYVNSIQNDVKWLGFEWGDHLYFASDYFEQMYKFAEELIGKGLAYVDSSSEEEIRELRGTVVEPGRRSKYAERSVDENLDLFRRMRGGEFKDGEHVLRAKIDMSSTNMLMRDPILYRIRHASHYRTGDDWCIYPLYDYAHPIEDALECVTHSLCTLEFDNNREFYDWLVENITVKCRPHQYEFARLNLDYTVMSKRKLLQLVNENYVSGWDDPRMPTIAGLRRRGVTPQAIRSFCDMIGVAKSESRVDIAKLEYAIRDDLNQKAPRVLGVLRPLRVVITNYPSDQVELIEAPYFPHDVPLEGARDLPFSQVLYIDRDDFAEEPPKGWHRLAPGAEVRLRYAYIIKCDEVVRDESGEIVELRCSYDPETRGGDARGHRNVKGTIQWVSAAHALNCEVRLYDRLFSVADPDQGDDFKAFLNPESLVVLNNAFVEPSIKNDPPGSRYQFERVGYFCSDMTDSKADALVFNRTVTLRDTWAKVSGQKKEDEGRPTREKEVATSRKRERERERERTRPLVTKAAELQKREQQYVSKYGLDAVDADLLTRDAATAEFFEEAVADGNARAVAKLMINIGQRSWYDVSFAPRDVAALVALVDEGTISASAAKEVLAEMFEHGGDPRKIVESRGLAQISDANALEPIVHEVVAANNDKVEAYRAGRTGLLGFFVGQVMSRTGGRANAELVKQIVEKQLA